MAKSKPYRCQNESCSTDPHGRLIFDFWAEKPVCPKCGTDRKLHPDTVIELALTHFDPPHPTIKRKGQRVLACTGKPFEGQHATGNPSVVNCPGCKATDIWKKVADEWGHEELTAESEVEIEAELKKGQAELLAHKPATAPVAVAANETEPAANESAAI